MEVIPYRSIGPAKLGQSRDEVRAALASRYRETNGLYPYDFFENHSMIVCYDNKMTSVEIEVFRPATAEYKGKDLLGLKRDELTVFFRRLGLEIIFEDTGFTIPAIGLSGGFSIDNADESDTPQSICIFTQEWGNKNIDEMALEFLRSRESAEATMPKWVKWLKRLCVV